MKMHKMMPGHMLLCLLTFVLFAHVEAQQNKGHRVEGFWNKDMFALAEPESNYDWVYFKDEVNPDPTQLFSTYANAFELGADDEFRINKLEDDELGFQHYRFDQYYKDKQVIGGEFIVHVNQEGKTYLANGKMVRKLDKAVQPMYTEDQALTLALDHVSAETWLWDTEIPEHKHQDPGYDLSMYGYPEGKLVWVRASTAHEFLPEFFYLAWEFPIYTMGGEKDARVFVDATNGAILDSYPLSMVCDFASGTTTWDGTRNFYTDAFLLFTTTYSLIDDCGYYGGGTVTTLDDNFGGSDLSIADSDNNWTELEDRHGVTTHWGVRESKKYFNLVHSRDSYNDAGGSITAKNNIQISGSWNNACYCGGELVFGPGSNMTYDPQLHWNTLDIVAHEWTHAVINSSANLTYSNESGALNESFADIFGNVVPRYLGLETGDWLIAEKRNYGTGAIRDMANPNAFSDPDTYFGSFWYFGSDDFGGVHTNSGVQNRWFTLLVDGGSGTNDWSDQFEVSGIGVTKARDIAYRNLNVYLTSGSQYIDARQGSLQASNDLFGVCSNESVQTGKAWYAVGVGTTMPSHNVTLACGNYTPFFWTLTYTGTEELRTGFGCTTTVTPSTAGVVFRSGEKVLLREGFTAQEGSNFTAKIDDCSYTLYRMPDEFAGEEVDALQVDAIEESLVNIKASPNPFTEHFLLTIDLPQAEAVSIKLLDMMGRTVSMIAQRELPAGTSMLTAHLHDVPAGIYLVVLEGESHREEIRVECVR